MSTSDGSTADYYELPDGATELQDLISHRNLNAQDGEIFRAIYRKGRASHSDELRDARKVLFYAQAEVKRLEKIAATPGSFGQQNMIDPADVGIASAIDDDSPRMQAIGQNGNGGEHYGAPEWSKAPDSAVLYIDRAGSACAFESSFYCDGGDRFYRLHRGVRTTAYVLKRRDGLPDTNYPYYMFLQNNPIHTSAVAIHCAD